MAKSSRRNQQQFVATTPLLESSSRKRQRTVWQSKPLQRIGLIALFIFLIVGGIAAESLSAGSRAASSQQAPISSGNTASSPVALASLTSAPTNNIPLTLVAAKEGDINAKYRQVVKTARADGKVTLTIRDNDTNELFTLTQPVGTNVVARDDKKGGTEVLTRLPSVPEHIDMDKYDFPTSNIETMKKGQQVVSRNPDTGKTEIKTVARTFQHTADEIVKLDLTDKSGKVVDSIKGTPEHPFFTPNGVVAMGKLKPGMEVSTRNQGPMLIVNAVTPEHHPEGIPVYNFEVEGDDTYVVGKAQGGTWVHNICDGDLVGDILKTRKGSIKNAELEPGSPSWDNIPNMSWKEIQERAARNEPGYKTIRKLLTDGRFKK